jgi:hypothetical protein
LCSQVRPRAITVLSKSSKRTAVALSRRRDSVNHIRKTSVMNPAERRTYGTRLRQLKKIKRECTLCCRLMDVDELDKPADKWCEHCQVGTGCRIYEDRPKTCRGWSCQWLARPDRYPEEELRPDRCGFLLDITKNDRGWFLVVSVDCGDPADEQTWPPRCDRSSTSSPSIAHDHRKIRRQRQGHYERQRRADAAALASFGNQL